MLSTVLAIITIMLLFIFSTFAQPGPPEVIWEREYGGWNWDDARSIVELDDGWFVFSGASATYSSGAELNFWLVKISPGNNISWLRNYGEMNDEVPYDMKQTSDGGFIMVGYTAPSQSDETEDIYMVKTDSWGNEEWNRTLGGDSADVGNAVVETGDNGYALAGYTRSFGAGMRDGMLIKTDSTGNEIWSRTFGRDSSDAFYDMVATPDGGFAITGNTNSYDNPGVWLVKTDSTGNENWRRIFEAEGSWGYSLKTTYDGGFIIAGVTGYNYYTRAGEGWLIKADSLGNMEWNRTYGGDSTDIFQEVSLTTDSGFICTGCYSANSDSERIWVVRTDRDGDLLWEMFLYRAGEYCTGFDVLQTRDGGFLVAGESYTNLNAYIARLGPDNSVGQPPEVIRPGECVLHPPYPNPFNCRSTVSFKLPTAGEVSLDVYDIMGHQVCTLFSGMSPPGAYRVIFDGEGLASGIYIIRLQSGEVSLPRKCLLIK